MQNQDQAKNNTYGGLKLFAFCAVEAVAIAVALIMCLALLVSWGTIPMSRLLPAVIAAESVGVAIASRTAARTVKSRKLLSGLAVSGIVIFLILTIGIPFAYPLGKHALLSVLFIIISGTLGGLWGMQTDRKRRGKH
ncbi:MAG: TIGR04086 family membrane protein [Oscillospiraceae bacterium]|nr:TIGR04086 family membrane protein [Oscillospiraceae bacterium]